MTHGGETPVKNTTVGKVTNNKVVQPPQQNPPVYEDLKNKIKKYNEK